MAELTTIARPYSKAAFLFAKEQYGLAVLSFITLWRCRRICT